MALTKTVTMIPGSLAGGLRLVTDVVTLASGTAEFNHGLKKARIISIVLSQGSDVDERFRVNETLVDGWVTPSDGKTTIASSNGSSTAVLIVAAVGYGS